MTQEIKDLQAQRDAATTKRQINAYNERAKALNRRIESYEKEVQALTKEITAYNDVVGGAGKSTP